MLETFSKDQLKWLEKQIGDICNLPNYDYIFNGLCDFQSTIQNTIKNANKRFNIKLCHIGGYELMRDGTQVKNATNLKEFFYHFLSYCEYSEYSDELNKIKDNLNNISDMQLYQELEKIWENRFDDGGGSGWFELDKDSLIDESFRQEYLNEINKQELSNI